MVIQAYCISHLSYLVPVTQRQSVKALIHRVSMENRVIRQFDWLQEPDPPG